MQSDYEEPAFDVHLCLNLIGNMLTYALLSFHLINQGCRYAADGLSKLRWSYQISISC